MNVNSQVDGKSTEYSLLLARRPETLDDILNMPPTKTRPKVYLKPYWKVLFLIACFYSVPSIQFILLQYEGKDNCVYNKKCMRSFLGLAAFNNVISNIGYVACGLFFIAYVRWKDRDSVRERPTGLHRDYSLYYTIGWTIVIEGLFSGLYHICPSKLNFQFDTTFMTMGAGLLFVTLYQKRQPTTLAGVYQIYSYFAGIIFLNLVSLLQPLHPGSSSIVFWTIVAIIVAYISVIGSIHLYTYKRIALLSVPLIITYYIQNPTVPKHKLRLLMILVGNFLNVSLTVVFVLEGLSDSITKNFPGFVLLLFMMDTWIYLMYYIIMKFYYEERVYHRVWVILIIDLFILTVALYFYNIAVSDKFLEVKESERLNKPCILFDYFDFHDIWHALSALGVVMMFLLVFLLDSDLEDVPRSDISVF